MGSINYGNGSVVWLDRQEAFLAWVFQYFLSSGLTCAKQEMHGGVSGVFCNQMHHGRGHTLRVLGSVLMGEEC